MKKDYYLFKYNGCKFGKKVLFGKGELKVLKNSLTLITGDNGCGKSTLIKKAFYNNSQICTMVSQENDEIFAELTIKENLSMMQGSIDDRFIEEELGKYNIEDILQKIPSKLSGGEKRLVSIIRGLWSDREVIFLDEPTNDLDYRIVQIIVRIIEDYKCNKTFVVVTHDERLFDIADSVYHIADGVVSNVSVSCECSDEINVDKIADKMIDSNLFHKIFKRDYLFLYFLGLITIVTAIFFATYVKKAAVTIEPLEDSHIEMCNAIYDNPAKLIKKGFLPTSILCENGKDGKVKTLDFETSGSYSFGLDIESTKNYSVYNMVLFDMSNSCAYPLKDLYAVELQGAKGKYFVDSSELFMLGDINEEDVIVIKFGQEEYDETYSYIKEKCPNVENIFLVIKPQNEYTFNDFMSEKSLQDLFEGDYYIRSNETIAIVENALRIDNIVSVVKNWAIIVSILGLLVGYYVYLSVKVIMKKVLIVANYGYDKEKILSKLKPRYVSGKIISIIVGIGVIAMILIFMVFNQAEPDAMTFIIPICYVGVIALISYFYNIRIRGCVKKIHRVEGEF
ncbi:MAG: ATP-binding cassette domain-containing protein [Lachnospira sp.]|nr:ATP-binding cassette domain-containing protein [Lachnospira sp.]